MGAHLQLIQYWIVVRCEVNLAKPSLKARFGVISRATDVILQSGVHCGSRAALAATGEGMAGLPGILRWVNGYAIRRTGRDR